LIDNIFANNHPKTTNDEDPTQYIELEIIAALIVILLYVLVAQILDFK
jgi:hypothetical protein